MADEGLSVVLNFKGSYKDASFLEQGIVRKGIKCIAVQADIAKEPNVLKLFNAVDKIGRLAVLVNNAGVLKVQTRLDGITSERFKR